MMKADEVEAMLGLYELGWGTKHIARVAPFTTDCPCGSRLCRMGRRRGEAAGRGGSHTRVLLTLAPVRIVDGLMPPTDALPLLRCLTTNATGVSAVNSPILRGQ